MIFIRTKWSSFYSKTKKNFPPSPRKLPIIGNFHQLGLNPNHSLRALSQKHGPIMLLHLGSVPTLVASSAEVAREIMKTHDLSFCSRPNLSIPNILFYGSNDIVFSPYGEYWRQLKSIVVVNFLNNTQVKSFRQVREKEIGMMMGMLEESSGSLVNMGSFLTSLTNNIICKVSVGRTYDVKLTDLLTRFVNMFTVFSVGSYIPWLSWIDWLSGLEGRAKKMAKEMDAFLESVIEENTNKKSEMKADHRDHEGKNLVEIMLNVQRDNTSGFTLQRDTLKCVILDIFAAATETTSTNLEWTINKRPSKKPESNEKAATGRRGRPMIPEEDLDKMQYLKAVIKESLRLHPSLPLLLPREAIQDVKLMGYDISSGTQVIINAWAIGRDPAKWEDPEEFRPERFMNKFNDYKAHTFEWIPFGAGRRGCPGIQFGVVVMELALANIVYKFDLALPNGINCEDLDMTEKFGITVHRNSSLMVSATPRF
ncbi:hypothetical protein OSB04_005040 [Centaurea solstitialis]|uniref:Cytochrome P450 n=1 Tax=Centaurea solstitialis TaxID=347529 RepID=A0AA38WPB8_9ASTR|nr:hypothetical protein OSB04_005040 [Centaurea solstitialis]